MDNFLDNPEERISSFRGTVEKALIEDENSNPIPAKKEEILTIKKKKTKGEGISSTMVGQCKNTFSIKLPKEMELPIRKALLEIFEKTNKSISIQQFISSAVYFYIENKKGKPV